MTAAERYARRIEGKLAPGVFVGESKQTWKDFQAAFGAKVLAGMEPGTKSTTQTALK
jgi:hypothetical protein